MFRTLMLALLLQTPTVDHIEPPFPSLPEPAAVPEVSPSSINVAVSLDLGALPALAEQEVPMSIDKMGGWEMVADDRIGIKYRATRVPIWLRVEGSSLTGSTEVEYEAEGCLRVRKPWPLRGYICPKIASCGQRDDKRRINVRMASALTWSPEWHVVSRTSYSLDYPNRCRVTALKYDVTPHLDRALSRALERAAANVDARVREVTHVRSRAEALWKTLSEPMQIGPSAWLTLAPSSIRVAPLRGSGLMLNTALGLTLQPKVVFGERPEVNSTPLPPLEIGEPGREFKIALEARLPFEEINRVLGEKLKQEPITFEGQEIQIKGIEVRGEKGMSVVKLSLHIPSGLPRPTDVIVYLTGRPRYDTVSETLSVEDVDYSLETRSKLVKVFATSMVDDEMFKKIRERVTWSLGAKLGTTRQKLEEALNRQISPTLSLKGRVEALKPLGIVTTQSEFAVIVEASGQLEATVKLAP